MAAFNFPNSPSTNDVYTANGVSFKWNGTIWQRISSSTGAQGATGSGGPTGAQGAAAGLTISTSAPGSPSAGDMWWDSDSGLFLTYYNDGNSSQWVELNQGPIGAQGAQGHQGATGAQGATGSTGAQGAANSTTINNNANDRIITGSNTANTLNGNANLTYSNQKVSILGSQKELLGLQSTHSQGPQFSLSDSSGAFAYLGSAKSLFTGGSVTDLGFRSENSLAFGTNGNNERLRISSDGLLLLDTTDTGFSTGYTNMTIGNTSTQNTGLTIASSSTNGFSRLHFADGNSSSARYAGWIVYDHAIDAMKFSTNNSGSAKLSITSGGQLNIGGNLTQTNSTLFVQGGSGGSGIVNLLELKHANTSTSTGGGTGDGPGLLLNGYYSGAEWQFAKICSVNSGSGYGADFQLHVHPSNSNQGASLVKALSVLGDGTGANVTITDGNLKIGTAGHGIDFSATSDAPQTGASMNNELLDDYEEGTFTPVYHFGGTSSGITQPSNRLGRYTKIGNRVLINIWITGTTNTGHSGYFQIGGLPFNNASSSQYTSFSSWVYAGFTNHEEIIFRTNPNDHKIEVQRAGASVFASQMSESANYMIGGNYMTD